MHQNYGDCMLTVDLFQYSKFLCYFWQALFFLLFSCSTCCPFHLSFGVQPHTHCLSSVSSLLECAKTSFIRHSIASRSHGTKKITLPTEFTALQKARRKLRRSTKGLIVIGEVNSSNVAWNQYQEAVTEGETVRKPSKMKFYRRNKCHWCCKNIQDWYSRTFPTLPIQQVTSSNLDLLDYSTWSLFGSKVCQGRIVAVVPWRQILQTSALAKWRLLPVTADAFILNTYVDPNWSPFGAYCRSLFIR